MASRIPKEVKKEQTDRWAAEVLYVALFANTSNCNTDGISTYSACTNQVTGTGYTAGGKILSTTSAYSSTDAVLDATDVTWTGITLVTAARYAVVYVYSGTNIGLIRGVFELGQDAGISGGILTVRWNASGLVKVEQG